MCTEPKTLWFRYDRPINYQSLPEQIQKNLNRAKFTKYPKCYSIQVPCGKCLECKLAMANEWAGRCQIEAKNWIHNYFITLTYDEKNLPVNKLNQKTLKKKDFQNFMKRLRKATKGEKTWVNPVTGKTEQPIRYFACGEYGEKTKRPHYHAIIFNLSIPDLKFYKKTKQGNKLYNSDFLQKIWTKGFVVIGLADYASCAYTARYVQKKAYKQIGNYWYIWNRKNTNNGKIQEKKRHILKTNEPEFTLMSRGCGIGRNWFEENKEFLKKLKHTTISIKTEKGLKIINLPRYFKKLWNKYHWESYETFKYEQMKKAIQSTMERINKHNLPEDWNDYKKIKWYNEFRDNNLKNKAKFLKRDNFL